MPKLRTVACAVVFSTLGVAGLRLAARPESGSKEPLTVHEWGTFTALQDDDGEAVGAINADDEPVPWFVCQAGGVYTPVRIPRAEPRLQSFNPMTFSSLRALVVVARPGRIR